MSKSFMIVCVLAVVLKGYNNSHTAVTQGYSHPCSRVNFGGGGGIVPANVRLYPPAAPKEKQGRS